MQSKKCERCGKIFNKTSNISQKYWDEKRRFCSKHCANSRPSTKKGKIYPHLWKNNVKPQQLHNQVRKKYGNPQKCSKCGSTENVQWANKSNEYLGVDDFIELCASCHKKYDNKMNNNVVWNKGKKLHYEVWNKGKEGVMPKPWNKSDTYLICPTCNKKFHTSPSAVKAGRRFCSKECYWKSPSQKKGAKARKLKWAMKFDKCISCNSTENKHQGKGLCTKCYMKKYYNRNNK